MEADMGRGVVIHLVVLLLASAAYGASGATSPTIVVPTGGLVLDGGDVEDGRVVEGSCLDPSLEEALPSSHALAASAAAAAQTTPAPRPLAFEYSDGYRTRLKIHKYASFATLPLFVAQFAVGQKLYDGDPSEGTRSLHGVLAGGTAVLFGVNTVTGVWNLAEGRKDPNHRTKRMLHGILMAIADAGFVATGLTAPESEHEGGDIAHEGGEGSRSTHRAVALASMGVATVAYLVMLIH
jgi:hypothetical protein